MRISDWSSDVCSSDLGWLERGSRFPPQHERNPARNNQTNDADPLRNFASRQNDLERSDEPVEVHKRDDAEHDNSRQREGVHDLDSPCCPFINGPGKSAPIVQISKPLKADFEIGLVELKKYGKN